MWFVYNEEVCVYTESNKANKLEQSDVNKVRREKNGY